MTKLKSTAIKKLEELSSPTPSGWKEYVEFLVNNREWIAVSQEIATRILTKTIENKQELSERTGIKPERIQEILKGMADITLSELVKLENATGLEFLVKERKQRVQNKN